MISIDTNAAEDFLFERLKTHFRSEEEEGDVVVQRTRLDLGDVQIVGKQERTLLVERKSWNDWCASICDGRYSEQKQRFLRSRQEKEVMVYVVEMEESVPNWHGKTRGMSNAAANAAVLKTQLRDGIPVVQSHGKAHTSSLVCYLADQVLKGTLRLESTFAAQSWSCGAGEDATSRLAVGVSSSKRRKIDNLDDPSRCAVEMLSVVPGMSRKSAEQVLHAVGGMRHLKRMSVSNLAEVRCGDKQRRLGTANATRINQAFFSETCASDR